MFSRRFGLATLTTATLLSAGCSDEVSESPHHEPVDASVVDSAGDGTADSIPESSIDAPGGEIGVDVDRDRTEDNHVEDQHSEELPPISTVRTIGGVGADYPDFTSAVNDLVSTGVPDEGILYLVNAGSYPERFTVPGLSNSSESNPVMFLARGEVVVNGKGTPDRSDAMITLQGCDYVAFRGINVEDGGTSANDRVEIGYLLTGEPTNGARHNAIGDCRVVLNGGTDFVEPLSVGVSSSCEATTSDGTCDYNLVERVTVDRAASGIGMISYSEVALPDHGNEIRDCVLGPSEGIGWSNTDALVAISSGVFVQNQTGMMIQGNRIRRVAIMGAKPVIPSTVNGISLHQSAGDVRNNIVYSVHYDGELGEGVTGIRAGVRPNDELRIYNNFVSGLSRSNYAPSVSVDPSLYLVGIWVFRYETDDTGPAKVAHNTVMVQIPDGMEYPSAAFMVAGGSGGAFRVEVTNNVFVNDSLTTASSAGSFAIVDGNSDRSYVVSDHNVLFASGPQGLVGEFGRELGSTWTSSRTLAEWQSSSGQDLNSVCARPEVVALDQGDLHLTGASVGDPKLAGIPLSFVPRDIDSELRSTQAPYCGADEVPTHPLQ
jgi:hypothetical protein